MAATTNNVVEPLTNFQIFKQKSLNTIPAYLEKNKKTEELFNNFPFLTPLAHRKNSLISESNKLAGRVEDEFYCLPSDRETEVGPADEVDVRYRFKSLSNQNIDNECRHRDVRTSTPKDDGKHRVFVKSDKLSRERDRHSERFHRPRSGFDSRRSYSGPAR